MPVTQNAHNTENSNILEGDGTAPKALPEDTSEIGEDGIPLSPRDHSGVHFVSPSRDSKNGDAKVELGAVGSVPQFVGLGKEELMRYANDPFWVRLRWFLFILFWIIWIGMLVVAIVIIVYAPKCTSSSDKVSNYLVNSGPYYQISLNAVTDEADRFSGLQKHIDHIKNLGVKTVIISQFQDLADFRSVNPATGGTSKTLSDLINAFKNKDIDIRVLLQLSPNHSSKQHRWFTSKPNYYVIEGTEKVSKSTWKTFFHSKAWSPIFENSTESYLHQFQESLADLNYRNEDLVKEMNEVLQHWYNVSEGVHGFLLSDVSYLIEDLDKLEDEKSTINQDGNRKALEKILDSSNWKLENGRKEPFALLDVDHLDAKDSMRLYTGEKMIPILTDFATRLSENFTAEDLKAHAGSVNNHFVIRRLSGPRTGRATTKYSKEREHILAMIAYLLRGEVILYYGDEVGLQQSTTSQLDIDGGFETMNWNPDADSVKISNFYKQLGNIHGMINQTSETNTDDAIYKTEGGIFAFKRDQYIVVANLDDNNAEFDLKSEFLLPDNVTLIVKCSTPNSGLVLDEPILPSTFTAVGTSGYVMKF